MNASATAPEGAATKPAFDQMMLAMDAVDTLRHEASVVANELSSDERREALYVRLREYYAGQGIEVSDEILENAVAGMDAKRFVHQPLPPGPARILALMWVRRVRYGVIAGVAVALAGTAALAVSATNSAMERRAEALAAERAIDLETRLPARLEEVSARIEALREAAETLRAVHALSPAITDGQRDEILSLIAAGRAEEASAALARLSAAADESETRIAAARLAAEAESLRDDALPRARDEQAAAYLGAAAERLAASAARGDETAFERERAAFEEAVRLVETRLEIRIVDRDGTRSGVWRTNDNGRTRVHYLIVEAVDAAGRVFPMDVRNVETGRTERVTHWGVRVPEAEYDRVGADKTANGLIDEPHAGWKPSGRLSVEWTIPANAGQTITRW